MMEFKVGDIVTGNGSTQYYVTNNEMTKGLVTNVRGEVITIEVLEHEWWDVDDDREDNSFDVKAELFVLVEDVNETHSRYGL